ncbi:MAG TPA: valine--tRNA ligase, partial [Patescibacteria group bacterium]|nr:valine--tRNA ligase [Patescibacteria group bacterium]
YKVEPSKKIDAMLAAGKNAALLAKHAAVIRSLARVENLEIAVKHARPEKTAGDVVRGVSVYVPLGALVDLGAEKKRLGDELAMAEKYAASLEGKLSNKDFVARAPEQVVAGEREKLEATKDKIVKLRAQIEGLA